MDTKTCTKCGETKALDAFSRNQSWCKACGAEYRRKNAEAIAARNAEYYRNNAEAIAARNAEYHRKIVEALSPSYVASKLGARLDQVNPSLLALKRETLQAKRTCKAITNFLKEKTK